MMSHAKWPVLMAVLVAVMATSAPALAVQHLISPGDNWAELAPRIRPGDELVLLPGEHRPATFDNLHGTAEHPIIIRSLNVEHPATIRADRVGLRLRRPQHVHVRNVIITGATINGIEITDELVEPTTRLRDDPTARKKPWPAHLRIENVTIKHTGPIGRRNAMLLHGLQHISITQSTFTGWGGSAIALVGCHDVVIDECRFTGLEEFSQMDAVQIRAGSDRVRITGCIFRDPGVIGIALGGASNQDDFRVDAESSTSDAPMHEARRVRVLTNIIHGGMSAVSFANCDQCIVRNNTFIRPRRWVYLILDHDKPHLAPTSRAIFGVNLTTWQPGDLKAISYSRPDATPSGLTLEQNLWWSPDLAATRSELGEPEGIIQFAQTYTVDPKLNDQHVPTEPQAGNFGYDTP